VILLPLKLSVESGGVAFNNRGGIESLGPPCGGTILAQEPPKRVAMEMKRRNNVNEKNDFISEQT
jgi:hypothetical protein